MEVGTGDGHGEYVSGVTATAAALARVERQASRGGMTDIALTAASISRRAYGTVRTGRLMASRMQTLGLINDETAKAINMMAAGALAGRAVLGITRALIRLARTAKGYEWAAATAETTVQAVAQNWAGIALAVGAAASVTAAFKVGEYAGELSRTNEVNVVMGDARRDAHA